MFYALAPGSLFKLWPHLLYGYDEYRTRAGYRSRRLVLTLDQLTKHPQMTINGGLVVGDNWPNDEIQESACGGQLKRRAAEEFGDQAAVAVVGQYAKAEIYGRENYETGYAPPAQQSIIPAHRQRKCQENKCCTSDRLASRVRRRRPRCKKDHR